MPEYRTPGVYIEEISSGPRPVQASSTTDTGFVGVLTLPDRFQRGNGAAEQMFLPIAEDQPLLAWNRALAFRQLTASEAEEAPPTPPSAVTAPDEKKDDKASSGRKTTRPAAKQSSSKSSTPDTLLEALVQEALAGRFEVVIGGAPCLDPALLTRVLPDVARGRVGKLVHHGLVGGGFASRRLA